MKKIVMCAALLLAAGTAYAQGVGINTTGAAADTSAILDLSSTTKGLLLPRLTAAQRAAIVLPATGLVVFQTDGTQGMYWNAGTPAAPSWKLVGEAGAGGGGQWSTSGSNIYYTTGHVAVGMLPNQFRFAVEDTGSVFRIQASNSSGVLASFGGTGEVQVDAPNVPAGRLALLGNGNLGLGVAKPTSKLSFAPVYGKKISLFPWNGSDNGFGVGPGRLQIFTDGGNGGDVAIGTDSGGTFTEKFAFKNNGALAVGGNTGTAGQVLQSNGSGSAASWVSPSSATYNNCYQLSGTADAIIADGQTVAVPGLWGNLTLAGNARVIVTANVFLYTTTCAFCGDSVIAMHLYVDGASVRSWRKKVHNGANDYFNATSMLTLGPGSHTIEVRVENHGPTIDIGVGNASVQNQLSWQVVPQ